LLGRTGGQWNGILGLSAGEILKRSVLPSTFYPRPNRAVTKLVHMPIGIGNNGRTIDKTRMLVKRYFDIDHAVVAKTSDLQPAGMMANCNHGF
jgi:hypothetical protein